MYRIIACDLDETLLNSKHMISAKDIESIRKASALGVKIVLATGRPFNSTYEDLKRLGLYDKEDEYTISFNGGVLTENRGNRVLYSNAMIFEKASQIYQWGLKYGTCIHVYTLDTVYVYNYFPDERKYIEGRMNIVETFQKDLEFLRNDTIVKMLFVNTDQSILQGYHREMADLLADLEVSYSSNRYLEFNCAGVDKGAGLRRLAEILDIDIDDTIAVGDNINDLPMIKAAGLGIGVRNVNPLIRDECDVVLNSSNDEDPLTEVIERFILK